MQDAPSNGGRRLPNRARVVRDRREEAASVLQPSDVVRHVPKWASKSVESNVAMLERDIRQIMRWGAMNKVAFAPEKLEMIHISRKRNASSPSVAVSPELIISPVTAVGEGQPALRWLGVWIDRKLSFKRHVLERASKALKVARHIKGLAGVKFGPPAASLRKAVITCVQSSLLYGSEIWYGGRLKPSAAAGYNRNQLVSTKLGPLIDKVNKIIVLAALPSSTPAYASRSGLGLLTPPIRWTDPTEGRTKEAAAEHFNAWWSQLGRDTITVFSDGTEQYKDGAKLVGYGYAVYRGQTLARTGSGAINSISHVFDAEAIGALKGLQCALDIIQPTDERIWMCIDSTSVIWCMRANASNTSQWAFLESHTLIDRYKVGIKWSPGHMGIEGSEASDELANTGANEGRTNDDRSAEPTISGIGTTAKALADIATSDWWSQCHPGLSASYRRWKLGYSVTEPPELRLPRTVLHRLLATRTAHGDFAQYHRGFGHTEAELTCLCGFEKAPDYLVFCEISQRKFHAWPARPERPPSRPEEGQRYLSALTGASRALRKLSRGNPVLRHQCPCTANARSDNFGWFPYELRLAKTEPPLFNRYLAIGRALPKQHIQSTKAPP
ncbi:hypothetical protein DID88_008573 [Monilinia fructigena]|uniref:RNase H type-1 domain-containing protein n=1 Tax=Monilinia fructigena TaxID=38457 RepID=A0A395J5T6_9HELO|nr:hypothetical protein DID88_008573 [Monilinia fructigena]